MCRVQRLTVESERDDHVDRCFEGETVGGEADDCEWCFLVDGRQNWCAGQPGEVREGESEGEREGERGREGKREMKAL